MAGDNLLSADKSPSHSFIPCATENTENIENNENIENTDHSFIPCTTEKIEKNEKIEKSEKSEKFSKSFLIPWEISSLIPYASRWSSKVDFA